MGGGSDVTAGYRQAALPADVNADRQPRLPGHGLYADAGHPAFEQGIDAFHRSVGGQFFGAYFRVATDQIAAGLRPPVTGDHHPIKFQTDGRKGNIENAATIQGEDAGCHAEVGKSKVSYRVRQLKLVIAVQVGNRSRSGAYRPDGYAGQGSGIGGVGHGAGNRSLGIDSGERMAE